MEQLWFDIFEHCQVYFLLAADFWGLASAKPTEPCQTQQNHMLRLAILANDAFFRPSAPVFWTVQ